MPSVWIGKLSKKKRENGRKKVGKGIASSQLHIGCDNFFFHGKNGTFFFHQSSIDSYKGKKRLKLPIHAKESVIGFCEPSENFAIDIVFV